MPWFCGYCSRWNRKEHRVCPYCGRAAKGRLCRKCKEEVPKDALYCTGCGSNRLTEPGVRRLPIPLPASRPARLGLVGGGLLTLSLLVWGLSPLLQLGIAWVVQLLVQLAIYVLLFWFLTALLPDVLRKGIRGAAWACVRFLVRFIKHLFG